MNSPSQDRYEGRSVLVTGLPDLRDVLRATFAQEALAGWEVRETDGLEQAHFLLQHGHGDVWLIDDHMCRAEGENGLVWLTTRRQTPVLLLADLEPHRLTSALEWGCEQWLARDLAGQAALLRVVLAQTLREGELRRCLHRQVEELRDCHRRVNCLAEMLWDSVSQESRGTWLTQRHALLRLQEEINRAERHGTPLTLVLGELRDRAEPSLAGTEFSSLASWGIGVVDQTKRRCDIVGRYGPNGFLLLLVQTAAEGAAVFCQRLRQAFQDRAGEVSGQGPPFWVSLGLAAHAAGTTAMHLLSLAEQSLEKASQAGAEGPVP